MARITLIAAVGIGILLAALGLAYIVARQEAEDLPPPEAAAAPAPAPATAASPAPAADAAAPSFDVARVNPNGDAVIAGRGEPGAAIVLLDNGQPIGRGIVDERGEWVLLPDSALAPGEHKLTLRTEAKDRPPVDSAKAVIVVVPQPAQDIAGNASDAPAGALALEVPLAGNSETRVLSAPGGLAPIGEEPSLDAVDFDADGRIRLSGRAPAGSTLWLYLDGSLLGKADADAMGHWRFAPEAPLPSGQHELRIDRVDGEGKVLARIVQPIAQPEPAMLASGKDIVVVQPGNSLWRIARRVYGEGLRYTTIYEANKAAIRDPDLIYPGQVFALPAAN